MTAKPQLAIVPPDEPEPKVDITLLIRADIKKRDWGRVMIEGDRAPPVNLGRHSGRWSLPPARKEKSSG